MNALPVQPERDCGPNALPARPGMRNIDPSRRQRALEDPRHLVNPRRAVEPAADLGAGRLPLGAAYLAEDPLTRLAEVFQPTRFADVDRDAPNVAAFSTARELVLADLTGPWLLKAGASAQPVPRETSRTQAWAGAIHEAWPDLNGLIAPSAVVGGQRVVTPGTCNLREEISDEGAPEPIARARRSPGA
jgi:RES domain